MQVPIGRTVSGPYVRSKPGPIYKGLAVITLTSAVLAPALDKPWSLSPSFDQRHGPRSSFEDLTAGSGQLVASTKETDSSASTPAVGTVSGLRIASGLTADQISRLFGVSRRSVQNWVAGAPMASAHEERLAHLYSVVLASGKSPEDRRKKLLSSAGGKSRFHQLIGEINRGPVLEPPALSSRDALGI